MKPQLLILLALLSLKGFGQKLAFYFPNGKKAPSTLTTPKKVLDSLGIEAYTSYDHKYGVVYLTELYKTPLFVILWDKNHPEQIKPMLAARSAKYQVYSKSYDYYSDLNRIKKEGRLTDDYLLDIFGKPSLVTEKLGFDSTRIYFPYNCSFDYKDGLVAAVNIDNYTDAIYKHKLLINEHTVTGDDYSIGFDITLTNFSTKPIKYIYIATVAKNPVKDVVGRKTFRGVGPIEPGEKATYSFENGIYSRTAKYMPIESIRIQYFDGTQKILSGAVVDSIKHFNWSSIE